MSILLYSPPSPSAREPANNVRFGGMLVRTPTIHGISQLLFEDKIVIGTNNRVLDGLINGCTRPPGNVVRKHALTAWLLVCSHQLAMNW